MGKAALVWTLWSALLVSTQADTNHAEALEFSTHANTSPRLTAIRAEGSIQNGDTTRLQVFLAAQPRRPISAIYLSSPGGSLYEGLRLGRYFKDNRIKTIVEGGSICASACAFAFLGGHDEKGKPWRSSSDNSQLGFHAFSTPGQPLRNENETQHTVADLLAYGQEIDAPLDLLVAAFATPSDQMYWLSQLEICRLGIKLWSNELKRFLC
ncbi:hypothetical protein KHC28_26295 [Ancylobacter sonchi]|uniref:COG3904 family protein n=1 Tax=Ancylobacter sonchi TaxID=1937790 RepID=UPI001BD52632|nr:hypothetical protein [Ancylobacter sonchi]MBS7537164.1 hypothetical protein [Ancylobacter sonchi]